MAQIQRTAALMEQVVCVSVFLANDSSVTGVPKKLLSLTETIMNTKAMATLDPVSYAFVNASLCEDILSSAKYQSSCVVNLCKDI